MVRLRSHVAVNVGMTGPFDRIARIKETVKRTAALRAATPAEQDESEEADSDDSSESDVQVLGDSRGVLGVRIESPREALAVTVTITGNEEPDEFLGNVLRSRHHGQSGTGQEPAEFLPPRPIRTIS